MSVSRSRSKSGCHRITPAVYCPIGKRKRSRSRRRKSRRRSSRRRKSASGRRRRGRRGKRRRRKSSKRKKKKCARPGPKTTNPFLNYLRVFRRKHCGWPACKIAIEGAKCWCKMNEMERRKYYRQACSQRKGKKRMRSSRRRKRRGKRGSRSRKRRRGGRRRARTRTRKRGKKKGKCPT